ncbi:MAG: non-homologous end-joining DNA ligase, partial [Jatrophihabitantaceae bacterium]
IVELIGSRVVGRFALIRTGGSNWLLHRMNQDGVPHREADVPPSGAVPSASSVSAAGVDVGGAAPATVRRSRPRAGRDAAAPPETGPTDSAEHRGTRNPDARWGIVPPMLATAGTVPGLTADQTWRLEGKWDGIRAVAYVGDGPLELLSRAGNDITGAYPELAELAAAVAGHSVILDGEIVADGRGGIPDFGLLQQRMGLTEPRDVIAARARVPVRYLAFDLLWLDGISLLRKTYDDRRRLLDALGISGDFVAAPAQLAGSPAQALAASERRKLEGIVAKRADSVYLPGRRTGSWIKIKHRSAQEVVIVGWRPGAGRRTGGIGSLLMAVPVGDRLRYAGRVGTGFTDAMLDRLAGQLKPLARATAASVTDVPAADAADAVWVKASLVGEVLHAGWTADRRLRQATWRGLRPDKSADQVTSEE